MEWLRQVVIGIGVESGHSFLHTASCGKHDHRQGDASLAQTATYFQAVDTGKKHVGHDLVLLV